MYDGGPCFVEVPHELEGDWVYSYPLEPLIKGTISKPDKVKYTDDRFSYKQFPLGYGWCPQNGAVYFSRLPDRKQKQGLSRETLKVNGSSASPYNNWLTSTAMLSCIKGDYLSLEQAISKVTAGVVSTVPFSRYLAVSALRRGLVCLSLRGREIAVYEKDKQFTLLNNRDKKFLMSTLQGKEGLELR